jgi:hypothetical protein
MSRTVAEDLLDTLDQAGVQRIYGIVGDSIRQAAGFPAPRGPRGTGPLGAECNRPLAECVPRGLPGPGQRDRSVATREGRALPGSDRAGGREDFRHRPGDQPSQHWSLKAPLPRHAP